MLPSQQYDGDVLLELKRINNYYLKSSDPAHMLYTIIGIPIYKLWLNIGYSGDALRVMQILNAMFGAATCALFFLVLIQIGFQVSYAITVSLLSGFSYAFWTHTEDAFFIIPAAFFCIATLLLAVLLSAEHVRNRSLFRVLLGVFLSFSVLSYQNNLLLIPALMIFSLPNRHLWNQWIRDWITIGIVLIIIAGGVWLYQGYFFASEKGLNNLITWFFSNHGGISRGLWRRENLTIIKPTIIAWFATILPVYEGIRLRALIYQHSIDVKHFPSQITLLLIFLGILISVYTLYHAKRSKILFLKLTIWCGSLLWFVVPGLSVIWFDRQEVKLWLIPMYAIWILFGALLNFWYDKKTIILNHWTTLCYGVILLVFLGTSNFILAVWPNYYEESVDILMAKEAINRMEPHDLLISSGFDWTSKVNYFCSYCQVMNLIGVAQNTEIKNEQDVHHEMVTKIEETWKNRGIVYMVEYFGNNDVVIWEKWIIPYTGITPVDMDKYHFSIAWISNDEIVWKINPGY